MWLRVNGSPVFRVARSVLDGLDPLFVALGVRNVLAEW